LFSFENAVTFTNFLIFRLSYDTMSASKNKVIAKYFFFLYNEVNLFKRIKDKSIWITFSEE